MKSLGGEVLCGRCEDKNLRSQCAITLACNCSDSLSCTGLGCTINSSFFAFHPFHVPHSSFPPACQPSPHPTPPQVPSSLQPATEELKRTTTHRLKGRLYIYATRATMAGRARGRERGPPTFMFVHMFSCVYDSVDQLPSYVDSAKPRSSYFLREAVLRTAPFSADINLGVGDPYSRHCWENPCLPD